MSRSHALVALVVLLCGSASITDAIPGEPPLYQGRLLVDVLNEYRQRGLDLVFSSAVVRDDLRVTVEPTPGDPRDMLDEMLAPLGLRTIDGPGNSLLIVPEEARGSIRGRVVSAGSRTPVTGATARVGSGGPVAVTDATGAFEIDGVPAGECTVEVTAPGFLPAVIRRVEVGSPDSPALRIQLKAHPAFVTEVVVTPSSRSLVRDEPTADRVVTSEDAVLVPTIGSDVTRVIELLPGVAGADNTAAFSVRGSAPRDVSMVLDGLELYDPFHLESFSSPFSLIDNNAVDRIDFLAGGFTAELGDRLGGFVEIETVVPGETTAGELEVGTLNSRVAVGAPLDRGGSWFLSGRGWYPQAVTDTIEVGGGENLEPRFGDLYAKGLFTLSTRNVFSAHGLLAYDELKFQENDEIVNEQVDTQARSGYAWIGLLTTWSDALTSQTIASGGRIERRREGISAAEEGPVVVHDDRDVDFIGVRHDTDWQVADAHLLKAGFDARRLGATYRYSNELPDDPVSSSATDLDPEGTSFAMYVAHRMRISPTVTTELGLRWDRQTYTDDNQVSPRFNAVWRVGQRSELRFAAGRFSQSQRIHELNVEDGETTFVQAEVSEQAEVTFQYGFVSGLALRFDGYYRRVSDPHPRYENLFEPIELFPETTADRTAILPTAARLAGAELMLQGNPSRSWYWWVSYVRSSAEDEIDGGYVPRSWDQPNAGKFLVAYRRADRWSVSLSGTIHTGWPTTPVTAEFVTLPDGTTEPEIVPGPRNSVRYPTYVRFDLAARRSFRVGRGRLWLTLDVVNLTDRDNACCIDDFLLDPLPDGTVDVTRRYAYWLGFTPSFSVLWQF